MRMAVSSLVPRSMTTTGQGRHVKRSAATAASQTTEEALSADSKRLYLQNAAFVDGQRHMDALGQAPETHDEEVANQRRTFVHELRSTLHHTAPALT